MFVQLDAIDFAMMKIEARRKNKGYPDTHVPPVPPPPPVIRHSHRHLLVHKAPYT
jgi:hypothetical protein